MYFSHSEEDRKLAATFFSNSHTATFSELTKSFFFSHSSNSRFILLQYSASTTSVRIMHAFYSNLVLSVPVAPLFKQVPLLAICMLFPSPISGCFSNGNVALPYSTHTSRVVHLLSTSTRSFPIWTSSVVRFLSQRCIVQFGSWESSGIYAHAPVA